jgi:hypothetical protein
MSRTNILYIFVGVLVLSSAFLVFNNVVSNFVASLGLVIVWISVLPGLHYVRYGNHRRVPFFPLLVLFYAIFFGLPVFTIPLAWPSDHIIKLYSGTYVKEIRWEVLLLVIFGVASMITGYLLSYKFIFDRLPRFKIEHRISRKNIKLLLWIILTVHMVYLALPVLKTLPSIGQFLVPIGLVGFGGFFFLSFSKEMSPLENVLVWLVCLPLEFYFRITDLALTKPMLLLSFFLLLFWRQKLFKALYIGVVSLLIIAFFYNAVQFLKAERDFGITNFHSSYKAVMSYITEDEAKQSRAPLNAISNLTRRTGQLWIFHFVDDVTPDKVPYWQGATYKPLLTSFVPRVFYQNKPEERTGYKFGYRYDIIEKSDTHISINLPWITELLANFGWLGVIWGMALIGIFLSFLDKFFNAKETSDLEFAVGLTIILPLIVPESNFSLMVGSILPLTICLYVYFRWGSWFMERLPFKIFKRSSVPKVPA